MNSTNLLIKNAILKSYFRLLMRIQSRKKRFKMKRKSLFLYLISRKFNPTPRVPKPYSVLCRKAKRDPPVSHVAANVLIQS